MKKIIWLLSIISLFGLTSCGGESSKEAKELLTRLLNLIGIPHNIVVNICQDDNNNGFCESTELRAKITINKGDTIDDIWEKVSLDENGSYLLAHHDPSKKILMELQDAQNVHYDDGKFLFTYNPMSTELSILQMMVDAGHLQKNQTVAIKQLERQEDQDKFYAILLKDLETNLNTLRAEGLTAIQAMSGNVKEMADELITNGIANTLPRNINNCNGDAVCVDKELSVLSDELLIDENESKSIKETETKSLKTLLAGKTVYIVDDNEVNDNTLDKAIFSADMSSLTWVELVGSNVGEGETVSVSLNGMVLRITSDGIETITITEIKEDYLLATFREEDNGEVETHTIRIYFDETKARAYLLAAESEVLVPVKTIGSSTDWNDVAVIHTDASDAITMSGLDIKQIKMAEDANNLYLQLERAGLDFPSSEEYYYNYWIYFRAGDASFSIANFHDNEGTIYYTVHRGISHEGGVKVYDLQSSANVSSVNLEMIIPKSLNVIDPLVTYSVTIFTHGFVKNGDTNDILGEAEDDAFEVKFNK